MKPKPISSHWALAECHSFIHSLIKSALVPVGESRIRHFLFFLKKYFYLFIFGCAGSSLLWGLFSSCAERGLLFSYGGWATHCVASSICRAQTRCAGFSSCGSQALEHRLSNGGTRAYLLCGMWDPPEPGIEPLSPSLAETFFTTEPPGKPQDIFFFFKKLRD